MSAKTASLNGRVKMKDFASPARPTWCPGCGDYGILTAVRKALVDLQKSPHEVMFVSGIGCGSKLPDYINANGLLTIHGRPVPVATGVKLANPKLTVIVVNGDGDNYGIGGNHFLHVCRRNIDITHIVENNQLYALTKGQYSPTSPKGFITTTSPEGVIELPFPTAAIAFTAGATFIARAFAGQPAHMAEIFTEAIRHRGYALVDVMQPCVTFNKVNTYLWYEHHIYHLDDDYDPADREQARAKVGEWGDRIPVGVLYREERPTYGDYVPGLKKGPVVGRPLDDLSEETFEKLVSSFM